MNTQTLSDLQLERDTAREMCADLTDKAAILTAALEDANREIERVRKVCSYLEDQIVAARYNEAVAREERDLAIVKIFKVAKACEPCLNGPDAVCILASQVREVLGICPTCGLLGRIQGHPCTHCTGEGLR